MGFLKTLEASSPEAYRQYYLNYGQLRELVVELANNATPPRSRLMSADLMDVNERPVGRFQEMLQAELKKVNQFACVKHEALFLGLRRLCEDCKNIARRVSPEEKPAELQKMGARIEAMSEEVVHLDQYVRLNYIGFQKLTQKFDTCLGVSGSALFVAGLHCEPFCNVRFDDILILLGLAWARWRAAFQAAEQAKDATWKPPESFIRNTAKYWVKPEKVVLLKTRILKHLPYLIFGASMLEQERLLEPFALLDLDYEGLEAQSQAGAYSGTMEESQLLSSVYFDSPDGVCYHERIRREEGARLVRFRWYGENNLEPDKEIFVERKIHHEGWGGASSAKERSILPQSDIFEYMKGRFDIEGHYARLEAEGAFSAKARKSMKGICHEVNKMIQEKHMQPILRTSYYRCAFQLSTSNEVRVSLDTQMSLLNEFVQDGHMSKPWCHISSDLLAAEDIYRFPFAILEIKLQNVSGTPLWLQQTLADIEAVQVHKFSKFQHGMAFLHPERVQMLPHWHQDFQEWHEEKAAAQAQRGPALPLASESVEDMAVPRLKAAVAPGGEGHFLKDMQNLDPKAVFANERTLLHYAEKGLYSGALAVALLHSGDVLQVAGVVLAVFSGLFYIWMLVEYYSRLQRITGRAAVAKDKLGLRLDLARGPLIVVGLVGLVLLLSVAKAAAQGAE
mmetsp:Transcript_118925/g.361773  ORF Transcript_118925/g.361773 Transcript_118925/m.361773 type:complete len:677 (+) Transcript_118925:109-2139(+)